MTKMLFKKGEKKRKERKDKVSQQLYVVFKSLYGLALCQHSYFIVLNPTVMCCVF